MNKIIQAIAADPNVSAEFRAALPVGQATCPKCNGTARRPMIEWPWDIKPAGYRASDDTLPCDNCCTGMNPRRDGLTRVDHATGLGCMHQYSMKEIRNCYYEHKCSKCGDVYYIDSGD